MYPDLARQAHVVGTVKLWFVPDRDGQVSQAQVISRNPLLRDAALSIVKSWRFRQRTLRPAVRYETEFVYVLNVQESEGAPRLTVSMADYRKVEVATELYIMPIE